METQNCRSNTDKAYLTTPTSRTKATRLAETFSFTILYELEHNTSPPQHLIPVLQNQTQTPSTLEIKAPLSILMVVFAGKLSKFSHKLHSKLDHLSHHNHHHHHRHHQQSLIEPEWVALEAFQSDVSDNFRKLLFKLDDGSEAITLLKFRECFKQLENLKASFANLVKEIAYPMSKWEAFVVEEYLSYTLVVLDLLNSITSSIADIGSSRLSLAHAASLVESSPASARERLKPIVVRNHGGRKEESSEERKGYGKGEVIYQAVVRMKAFASFACGFLLFALSGYHKPVLCSSSVGAGELIRWEELINGTNGVKEMKEVNDAVAGVQAALEIGDGKEESEELEGKLKAFESVLDGVEEDVNGLFDEVMKSRNQLLDCLRLKKK